MDEYKNGIDSKKFIKKYEKVEDKLIIFYLDGTSFEMPFTVENEKAILDEMLGQAISRDEMENVSWQEKFSKTKRMLAFETAMSILATTNIYNLGAKAGMGKFVIGVGAVVYVLNLLYALDFRIERAHVQELDKYKIYLENKDKIDTYINNPNLYYGVLKKTDNLNINTLDNYSLKDLKKIRENLKKIEELSSYVERGKMLIKE